MSEMPKEIWAQNIIPDPYDEVYQYHPDNLWTEGHSTRYVHEDREAELIQQAKQNERAIRHLAAALGFYADEKTWDDYHSAEASMDAGDTAQQALKAHAETIARVGGEG